MALTIDTPRTYELGDRNTLPVKASTCIYEGAAVGDDAGGYARGLVANDPFRGFAERKADNSATATDGFINVTVKTRGRIQLAVASAAITDDGKGVFASADGTFVLTAASGTFIGKIIRYVSAGVAMVAFNAERNDGVTSSIVAPFTGTVTGTANSVLEDIAAAAGACAGSTTPSATQVDAAIATAVAPIVTGLNLQVKEIMTKINAIIARL